MAFENFHARPGRSGSTIPDVARGERIDVAGTLDKVGMAQIEVPVRLRDDDGMLFLAPAKAEAYVSLDDPLARGIHMSRLFITLQSILSSEELNLPLIKRLLGSFVASHSGLSRASFVRLDFDLLVKRAALVSDNSSWRAYPVSVVGEMRGDHCRFRLGVKVAYSSTCPCSAALARQLIQEKFRADFAAQPVVASDEVAAWLGEESSILATPHSQRSYALLDVEVGDPEQAPTFVELIDLVENALQTPVQAAVKREDEREFARLNGANLMFCEDAGRRLKAALNGDARLVDYRVEAVHVESLHPHNAVSVVVKGIPGGLRA
jgi:GTP cyclohydrolase I